MSTGQVPGMPGAQQPASRQRRHLRFVNYVKRLLIAALVLSVACLALVYVQDRYHYFDQQVAQMQDFFASADSSMSNEVFAGISLGTIVLVIALCIFPIFLSKIDHKAYLRSLRRGVVAAFVFVASNALFDFALKAGRLYLIVAIFIVAIVTALLVEAVALAAREEDERAVRSDIVASIASGLLFGVLLQLGSFALRWFKYLWGFISGG